MDPACAKRVYSLFSRLSHRSLLLIAEPSKPLAAKGLPQLEQAARLDLANALAGDAVAAGHFVQRPRFAVLEAKAQLNHLALALRQRTQHFRDAFPQQ